MDIKKNIAISDSGFILNPNTGESFSANPISNKMFEWIKEGKSDEEIIGLVLDNYSIDKDTVEKDFYDFTNLLKSYQLIDENKD